MTELSRKGSLPYGWQVKTSRRYPDRIYYFNIITGSSTWECPELDPPREIAVEDKKLSSVNKLESGNENTQLPKGFLKNLPKIEMAKMKCVPKDIKVSEALPDIKEKNKRKCDLSDSNSVKKFSKEHSQEQKHSIVESEKCNIPPTAIVAPVVLERKAYISQNETLSKSDDKLKKGNPRKRSLDEVLSNSHDNPAEVPKKVKSPKKIRISPLNRTDSQQKKSPSGQKIQREKKRLADSSSCSSDTDSRELAKKCPSESSSVSEDSKDVDDIEMLDVSMDIIDDLTAKKETVFDTFASYYIVVDTNVLISELSLINEIKDTPLDGCGPPHIFIPWIVIEELDRLKNQRSLKANCIRAAGEAIRYLNSVLGKHPRFHGQSPAEAEQWAKTYSKCNDDKILECCVALADKMPREKVILLTNDKNLVNKALICNVIVHDSSSLMKYVKPDVVFTYSKPKDKKSKKGFENGTSESVSPSEASKISQSPTESPVDKNLITKRDAYKREIHSIMSKARQLLKDALAKFFYEEMEEAYGEIWLSFPINKDLLEGILEGIKKYWTVFSDFMTAKDKRNFELLKEKVSRPAGFWGDKEDCLVILSTMEEIFTQVQKRKPSINVPVSIIQDFRVACVEFFHKYCDVDSAIQTVEQESTLALFERNWAAINQLSGIILDFCKLPHDFQYDKPDALPSESDIRRLICNLYPAVQQLKAQMFKMLDAVRNCKPLSKIIRTLAAALLNFFPSLEIPHEQVSFPSFSQAALERFCSRPQNREMLEIGCKQIEKFYSKLDDALSSIMSAKFKKTCASPETMICD